MGSYKKIKLKDGSTIDEHRFNMKRHLGRELSFNECVHHINGDKRDNRIENLEVVDRREHVANHWKDGSMVGYSKSKETIDKHRMLICGDKSILAKLTELDVKVIKELLQNGESSASIARQFGVHRDTVGCIKRGKSWKHVK